MPKRVGLSGDLAVLRAFTHPLVQPPPSGRCASRRPHRPDAQALGAERGHHQDRLVRKLLPSGQRWGLVYGKDSSQLPPPQEERHIGCHVRHGGPQSPGHQTSSPLRAGQPCPRRRGGSWREEHHAAPPSLLGPAEAGGGARALQAAQGPPGAPSWWVAGGWTGSSTPPPSHTCSLHSHLASLAES